MVLVKTDTMKLYLVNRLDNPIDPWVTTNSLVLWINEDNLEVFVGRVLIDPVRI